MVGPNHADIVAVQDQEQSDQLILDFGQVLGLLQFLGEHLGDDHEHWVYENHGIACSWVV